MRTFRLALAQVNPTVGDILGNTRIVASNIAKAKSLKADLVAFPELILSGYPPEDLLFQSSFIKANKRAVNEIINLSSDITVILGYPEADMSHLYNSAAILHRGKMIATQRKLLLPNYGVFDEQRYFRPGETSTVHEIDGVGIGVNICEDIWFPDGPVKHQSQCGAQIIVSINGSPYHIGKNAYRKDLLSKQSADNNVHIAYVNIVGGQDELVFDGASMVFNQTGHLMAEARLFEEDLLIVDIPVPYSDIPIKRSRRELVLTQGNQSNGSQEKFSFQRSHDGPNNQLEEIYKALVLGTRDYVHKNGFQQILLGLSGGVDSSLTCRIAVDALGNHNVIGVAMPSRYSTEASVIDATDLAKNLDIELWTLPIDSTHTSFGQTLRDHLSQTQHGVADQNLQARIRGTILMALSNELGLLVLTTGNKSELAMGYSTLYGDMAGGFAVIKDINKTLVYELTKWANTNRLPLKSIPYNVLVKAPSAELKPDQTDQDDLPPYDILDYILESYVEKEKSINEITAQGVDPQLTQRVINAVDRNEYKRRQAPTGIKITSRAFGKDRRMPIVNGFQNISFDQSI